MNLSAEDLRIMSAFHPYAFKRQWDAFNDPSTRFVHYTDASAAQSMLANKEVWMRNATCMNDYREIGHGLDCLYAAYRGDNGKKLQVFLNSLHPGICEEIEHLFNDWSPTFASQTYLFCVSEHCKSEDRYGRLSMWRAYGPTTAIAIVFKAGPFLQPSDALSAYTSPVAYLDASTFDKNFAQLIVSLKKNIDLLRYMSRKALLAQMFETFKYAALCTKHPGFSEEREWRVVYTHELHKSERLIKETRVIRGVPQTIYKIPLINIPEEGLTGVELPQIIERVIVGPTEYPGAARSAVIDMLIAAGIPDPHHKVVVSDIPVR